uniref:Uncharacterized protein n=1 Tax=Anguilla anguilla TaxID=7936 RepID=A0A0E9RI21_ANGAN
MGTKRHETGVPVLADGTLACRLCKSLTLVQILNIVQKPLVWNKTQKYPRFELETIKCMLFIFGCSFA